MYIKFIHVCACVYIYVCVYTHTIRMRIESLYLVKRLKYSSSGSVSDILCYSSD